MEKNNIEDLFEQGNSAYENGNFEDAFHFYKCAADLGHPQAQSYLAWQLFQGEGCEANEEKANELWLKAAQQGLPRAQCNLGLSYLDGTGILQDSQKAVYWLSKAAEGGDTHAAVCLGRSLLKGYSGVEKNCEKGLAFLKQAATRGEASAFHLLIDYSIDVEHDTQKALHYVNELEKIGGNLTGKECVLLALEILTCKESTYEEKRYATDLLEQAIDYDNPTAALLMGLCYDGGIAVDLNREQANRFYRCASRLGSHLAEQILEYYETSE